MTEMKRLDKGEEYSIPFSVFCQSSRKEISQNDIEETKESPLSSGFSSLPRFISGKIKLSVKKRFKREIQKWKIEFKTVLLLKLE